MSYQELNQYNSPNYTPASQSKAVFGYPRTIDGITIHWWGDPSQNPTFMSVVNWLCRANGGSSAHVVATGTSRQVAWLVNAADVAWHAGNARGNASTIGIECDPRCRAEDYDVVAEMIADIWIAYGRKLPLYPHRYWANTACPGNYDLNRLQAEAEAWFAKKTQPTPVIPTTLPVPDAKKLAAPVRFKATANPTNVWDLTTNPNYKAVKILNVGDEFIAFAYIDFNNTKYYVTEYSFNKGIKAGVNTVDLMEQVTVPPVTEVPPVEVTPEPPVEPPYTPPVTPETPPVVETPPTPEPTPTDEVKPATSHNILDVLKAIWDLIITPIIATIKFFKKGGK